MPPRFPAVAFAFAVAAAPLHARDAAPLTRDDVGWLGRVAFGVDSATVARYRELGRRRFLDEQLQPGNTALPADVRAQLDSFEAIHTPLPTLVSQYRDEAKRIREMPAGDDQVAAKKALQQSGNDLARQAQSAELLQAIYGEDQLREQMVWFWLNHFSVFANKGRVRWLAGDYAENSIRPHALGKFRDLVMATLKSPAMLEFLDNAQNAKGHVNENYARELMELHTLGVGSGYSQQDVQQLALILTGVGVDFDDAPRKLKPEWQALYVREGVFEFNPARHDFSDKVLLGTKIPGGGFDEVEKAVDLIVKQPACATFVSTQLARYFVGDKPPPTLIEHMAKTFRRSDGDIAAVLKTLFTSRELADSYGKKFKDPTQFLVSSMRLAYDGAPIANPKPLVNWINALGQAPFGRLTPDGWPLDDASWSSSGQLSRRFEIARSIGSGTNRLFDLDDGGKRLRPGFPQLASRTYYDAVEPFLGTKTREGLAKAISVQEWNTFLLASPDFNYR
jgi:uncharacterized protein (DUF1800 family)